ncbi:MAG: hypothetical protein ABS918_01540 [Saccharopolyspora rectivirgula]
MEGVTRESAGQAEGPNAPLHARGLIMSTREARLAAAIRQSQWLADDVAHDLPYRKVTAAQLCELAEGLTRLALELSRYAGTLEDPEAPELPSSRVTGRGVPSRND